MLYLDDDSAYVAGAREAGLSADRVGGAADVRASLAAQGLPTLDKDGERYGRKLRH
jgi:hypothetical protein